MGMTLAVVLVVVLSLLAVLVLGLATSLGIALIGWILSLLFPLSVFEGAIVALFASAGAGYVLYRFLASALLGFGVVDEDDDWEDEDDEPAPRVVSWREHRAARTTPKPASKGKRKRR
jgi:hypothetical protein